MTGRCRLWHLAAAMAIAVCLGAAAPRAAGPLLGAMDVPSSGATIAAQAFVNQAAVLAGWVFDCPSGSQWAQPTVRWYGFGAQAGQVVTSQYLIVYRATWWGDLWRPDVYAVYHPYCPNMTPAVGYTIYVLDPPAPGSWVVVIEWRFDGAPVHYQQASLTLT